MKKLAKSAALLLIFLLLLTSIVPVSVLAANSNPAGTSTRWNIMMVIDASRSLTHYEGDKAPTDENGLRFEAVSSFIDTIVSDGNYVGVVVFTAYEYNDDNDDNMRKGVYYNSWENGAVELSNNTNALKTSVVEESRKAQLALRPSNAGETDIGTAMLIAEESLEAAAAKNGLPCAMFLFTDGKNELNHTKTRAASLKNMAKAEDMMQANGTRMCGVLLNTNNNVDPSELREIVARSNGISSGSLNLGSYFMELKDINSIGNATDAFMELLGYDKGPGWPVTESCERTFRVPGVGVEEANIRLATDNGNTIPAGVDVKFVLPDGSELSGGAANALCSTSARGTYRIYKITNPMPGEWTVHIEVPKGCNIEMNYNLIFSLNIGADYTVSHPVGDLHANMTTEIEPYLISGGAKSTDPAAYSGYKCVFTLKNVDGTEQSYDVIPDGNGQLKLSLPLDYGEYYAGVKFVCDELEVSSPSRDTDFWDLKNHAPTASNHSEKLRYGLFRKNIKEITLSNCTDLEDGYNLQYSVASQSFDPSAVKLNGNKLIIDCKAVGKGAKDMTVTAADTQNAKTDFTVYLNVKDSTLTDLLLLLVALLLVGGAALLIIRMINSSYPNGEVRLRFNVPDSSDKSVGEKEIEAVLTPPGNGTPRSQNLYAMVEADLGRVAGSIKIQCEDQYIDFEKAKSYIDSNLAKDMKKVIVKCVVGKYNNERCPMLKVSGVGVVYNKRVKINIGGKAVYFGYFPPHKQQTETDDEFDYIPVKKNPIEKKKPAAKQFSFGKRSSAKSQMKDSGDIEKISYNFDDEF